MKICSETLEVLRNFSLINSNILVKPGSTLKTVATTKAVLAEATVPETFEQEFGIYDLTTLLGVVSLFDSPDFDFQDIHLFLVQGNRSVRYFYANPALLTVPQKPLKMSPTPIEFTISATDFAEIVKAANVLELPDLLVTKSAESGKVDLIVTDLGKTGKDNTSNRCTITVDGETEKCKTAKYQFHMKTQNLKFLPGDYAVGIAERNVAQFKNKGRDVCYWVSLNESTTYEE